MSVGLYLRCFCGFALQLVPCAMLLLVPFGLETFPKGRRRAFFLLAALSIGFSLCYPLSAWWNMGLAEDTNLDDNLFMLLAIVGVTALFTGVVRESLARKLSVLSVVIGYAAAQFFLSNMVMDFLPLERGMMVYDDGTLIAYLIVTAALLPPVVFFMRSKMRRYLGTLEHTPGARMELSFLIAILVLYLILNVLYSALWIKLRDTLRLSFVYYIPFALFLSLLLGFTFYSIINLSVFKAKNAEQAVELALMRQNYEHIEENIQQQKRALHDTRQLLRNIISLAKDGTNEKLLTYLNEAMEFTAVSDKRFCLNPCVNGLLGYYAGLAEAQGIRLSAQVVCDQLPFSDADMTILLGNALDNAVRAAAEYGKAPPQPEPVIQIAMDTINNQFAVQIENPCLSVSYTSAFRRVNRGGGDQWLPAEAFVSKHGGGYGLRRMEMIAGKYGGHAWFSFDAERRAFVTRLMLPANEV